MKIDFKEDMLCLIAAGILAAWFVAMIMGDGSVGILNL
jgi:hypothetical protein